MKNIFSFSFFFISVVAHAGFLPNSFRANFEQRFISTITGKEKISSGSIDYAYPGQIRFEVVLPEKTTFVSNGKKSWYYTAPFDPKEKGEVIIQPSNKLLITKFFDYLKNGLESNDTYTVVKEKNEYVLTFKAPAQKELSIEKARLEMNDKVTTMTKLSELKQITLLYKDNKKVKLTFSNLLENVKFEQNYFDYKIPENTKEVHQN